MDKNKGKLRLDIVTPQRKIVSSELIDELIAMGTDGEFCILPLHAPFLTTLMPGELSYKNNGNIFKMMVVSSGYLEVNNNKIIVLAETVEFVEEIDVKRARIAKEKAEKILGTESLDDPNFKKYQLKLQRAMIRLQAAAKKV